MPIRDFKDLVVWQRAVDLAATLYDVTRSFPREELFTLVSQVRRAGLSVSSNIAEGNGRSTTKDYLRFLSTANGSLNEVKSLLAVSERLGVLAPSRAKALESGANDVGKLLSALRVSLRRKVKRRERKPPSRP